MPISSCLIILYVFSWADINTTNNDLAKRGLKIIPCIGVKKLNEGWNSGRQSQESPLQLKINSVTQIQSAVNPETFALNFNYSITNVSSEFIYVHRHIAYHNSVINGIGCVSVWNGSEFISTQNYISMDGDDTVGAKETDFFVLSPDFSISGVFDHKLPKRLEPGQYSLGIVFDSYWWSKNDVKKWKIKPWRGELISNEVVFEIQ